MTIIEHGTWRMYVPAAPPPGAPFNAMFCRREGDGTDWYDYVHPGTSFGAGSVVFAAREADMVVGPATYDATAVFPAGHQLFEIQGYQGSDPQADFGDKIYDPATQTFTDQPPPVVLDTKALLDRLAVLEAKLGGS